MATQGLVTVMKGDRVLMKIVAGNDGHQAEVFAARLREAWPLSVRQAFDLAQEVGFGAGGLSLVALSPDEVYSRPRQDFEDFCTLYPRYPDTFQDPEFNPRWDQGTAEHCVVVKI